MNIDPNELYGGLLIAEVLAKHGVKFVFTLCGGHISPILIGSEKVGIRVVDVRQEVTAVFAADAMARLSGVPGVAAVTAGPGLTNTITAVKNAQMAQSPLILLGGAPPSLLKGRGALQDIDQMALMKPQVKWATTIRKVREIVPKLEQAFKIAQEGVPGPVFIECPLDLLYQESLIREWHVDAAGKSQRLGAKLERWYLNRYINRTFSQAWSQRAGAPKSLNIPQFSAQQLQSVKKHLQDAKQPVLVIGSQAMLSPDKAEALQIAVKTLGIPTFLSGSARGLLGYDTLHIRHQRSKAIREADVVLLAGVPCDFRLNYGRVIPKSATYISVNRSKTDLTMNRRPNVGVLADPGVFLRKLADAWSAPANQWSAWHETLLGRNSARDDQIAENAQATTEYINPVDLCQQMEETVDKNSILIGDGGDFVATASYIVRPRGPLRWLDPGPFGTLGVGAGFALAAKLYQPEAEVWIIYGDGSVGYSLTEFDTFARHNIPVIALVGTDASWAQIARAQVEIFDNAVATELARTPYHEVAEGYGGQGLFVQNSQDVVECLQTAQAMAGAGKPVLINAWIGKTDFRKDSLSM